MFADLFPENPSRAILDRDGNFSGQRSRTRFRVGKNNARSSNRLYSPREFPENTREIPSEPAFADGKIDLDRGEPLRRSENGALSYLNYL
ncbi:hypothetical protein V0288_17060 [Pannus brasiliensis CCIBt3594]|uniref:Uncharacterized protein n=1 Tax=Pannus brasiliensis CCIBt3594 TaxID=1427578 RepID=A0AAW9QM14_9CHRO